MHVLWSCRVHVLIMSCLVFYFACAQNYSLVLPIYYTFHVVPQPYSVMPILVIRGQCKICTISISVYCLMFDVVVLTSSC